MTELLITFMRMVVNSMLYINQTYETLGMGIFLYNMLFICTKFQDNRAWVDCMFYNDFWKVCEMNNQSSLSPFEGS